MNKEEVIEQLTELGFEDVTKKAHFVTNKKMYLQQPTDIHFYYEIIQTRIGNMGLYKFVYRIAESKLQVATIKHNATHMMVAPQTFADVDEGLDLYSLLLLYK